MVDETDPRRGRPGYDQATVSRRAVEIFERQGYDATSVGDLARELGITKSAIYHHVPSKEHLLAQALDEALSALTAVVAEAAYGRGPASTRLRLALTQSVEVLVAHQPAVALLLRARGNNEAEREAIRRREWIDATLADLVRSAVQEGALRDDVPADVASRLLFGMVHSLVDWYRPGAPGGEQEPAEVARTVAAIAFDGLTRR